MKIPYNPRAMKQFLSYTSVEFSAQWLSGWRNFINNQRDHKYINEEISNLSRIVMFLPLLFEIAESGYQLTDDGETYMSDEGRKTITSRL